MFSAENEIEVRSAPVKGEDENLLLVDKLRK